MSRSGSAGSLKGKHGLARRMVVYAMARRGASPVINAISAIVTLVFGVLILLSERVRST